MKEKFAVVYRRRGKLIFGAQGRTTAGVLVGSEKPSVVDAGIDPATIGAMLRSTLGKSRSPLPHPQPSEWSRITESFLQAVDSKTWGTFVRGTLLTTVEADGRIIHLATSREPWRA
jgi:hypothetical protein